MCNNNDGGGPDLDFRLDMMRASHNTLLEPPNTERDPPIDVNNNDPRNENNNLNVRRLEIDRTVKKRDLLLLLFPILTHLYDLGSDLYLGIDYFEKGKTLYGYSTIALIILPAITITWISARMFDEDLQQVDADDEDAEKPLLAQIVKCRTTYAIDIFFQLSMPLRYFRSLSYAWLVRKFQQAGDAVKEDKYYRLMVKEQEDVALLNIVGCFLESAPQHISQLTIVLTEDTPVTTSMWIKIVSGCVTLITLGWAMMKYHRAIRLAQLDKPQITWTGSAFIFISQFCIIAARIFLVGISASKWPLYTALACAVSCVGWTAVLYTKGDGVFVFCRDKNVSPFAPRSCMERLRAVLFSWILAVVYMFTFVNLGEGPTFRRYSAYHLICGAQNVAVVALWFWYTDLTIDGIYVAKYLLITSVAFWFVGVVAMMVYYTVFHTTVSETFFRYCYTWLSRSDMY